MAGHDDETGDLGPARRGRTETGPGGRPGRVVVRDLFPPGELVDGRYRIEGPLGQGGMGAVYRARDVQAGRDVALKVLLTAEGTRVQRFEREAVLLARLDRVPGVVHVHARGEHRGLSWLAMDLVEGHDLERPLSRGPLPVDDALALVESVARTVHACHALGLVHRDLKPSNILLGREGPRVVDFGLARGGAEARFTATGEIVGTPSFMAPEQVDGSFDARTDVWALGAILHTATTGALVVEATNLLELIHTLKHLDPTPPTALVPTLPPGLDVVVRGALARDPAARYRTAEALADDCARLRRGAPPLGPRGRAPGGRRPWVAGALLLLLAAALVAGVTGGARRLAELAALRDAAEARVAAERAWVAGGQDGWDLGLGPGPAPTAEALGARLAALVPAAGVEAEVARAELEALRRRLASEPGLGSDPLALAIDASIAAVRSDLPDAVRLADRAGGHPAGLRVRARLWRPLLAGARDAAGWEALRTWLGARPRDDPARALAESSAREGLSDAVEAVVRGAPTDPYAVETLTVVTRAGGDVLGLDVAALTSVCGPAKARALEESADDWYGASWHVTDDGARAFAAQVVALFQAPPRVACPPRLRAAQQWIVAQRLRAWSQADERSRVALGLQLAELDLTLADGVDPVYGLAPDGMLRVYRELVAAGRDDLPLVRLLGLRADAQDPGRVARALGAKGVVELERRWPRLRATRLLRLLLDLAARPAARGDRRLEQLDALLREPNLDLSYESWARACAGLGRAIEVATREGRTAREREWILEATPGARHRYSKDATARVDGWRLEAEVQPDVGGFREVLTRAQADVRERMATDPALGGPLLRLLVDPLERLPRWDDPRPVPDLAYLTWALGCGREALGILAAAAEVSASSAPTVLDAHVLTLRAWRLIGTPDALDSAEAVWARRSATADRAALSVEWVLLARARGDLVEARRRLAAERARLPATEGAGLARLEEALRD